MRIPNPDPGELWTDINTQLFGSPSTPRPGQVPTMDSFVRNYLAQQPLNPTETYHPKSVMHYFTPDQVPVLSAVNAFVWVDHKHVLSLVETIHGAYLDAVHGFAANAALIDDVGQSRVLSADRELSSRRSLFG